MPCVAWWVVVWCGVGLILSYDATEWLAKGAIAIVTRPACLHTWSGGAVRCGPKQATALPPLGQLLSTCMSISSCGFAPRFITTT